MRLADIKALIEPALKPGESIEDFLNEAVEARTGKGGGLPGDDLSEVPTIELVSGEYVKHPARLPNLIPRCILAIARWNDSAPEGQKISPTNSVIAKLGSIRPNDLTEWMPQFKPSVQEQDEQWQLSQFTNRKLGKAGILELIEKIELPTDGDASPKLQAA